MIAMAILGAWLGPAVVVRLDRQAIAFLMPVASFRFLKSRRYHQATALGLTLGGIPGVLVADYIVKSLPLVALRWVVAAAVTYVAASMLRPAFVVRAKGSKMGELQ